MEGSTTKIITCPPLLMVDINMRNKSTDTRLSVYCQTNTETARIKTKLDAR